jgi:hypothetical protein
MTALVTLDTSVAWQLLLKHALEDSSVETAERFGDALPPQPVSESPNIARTPNLLVLWTAMHSPCPFY